VFNGRDEIEINLMVKEKVLKKSYNSSKADGPVASDDPGNGSKQI